jgi:transcriptional regulator with XRE-family HTH domain
MTLERWLKKNRLSQNQFAEQSGISQSLLSKYIRGARRPNVDQALAIERATDGGVPVEQWESTTAKSAA